MDTPAERLPGLLGTQRSGKIAELRIESGILGIVGSAFCFFFIRRHLRRFRLFRISALRVGR